MPAFALTALRHWKLIALGLLIAALAVQTLRIDSLKGKLESARTELKAEKAGRIADRKSYEAAQRQAQEMNKAQVQQIERQQEQVTDELRTKYQRDLERLRNGGLRPEYTAPPGSPAKPGTPGVPETACRADAENVCVPRSVLVRAGEIELSRNALIAWINAQLGVKR